MIILRKDRKYTYFTSQAQFLFEVLQEVVWWSFQPSGISLDQKEVKFNIDLLIRKCYKEHLPKKKHSFQWAFYACCCNMCSEEFNLTLSARRGTMFEYKYCEEGCGCGLELSGSDPPENYPATYPDERIVLHFKYITIKIIKKII